MKFGTHPFVLAEYALLSIVMTYSVSLLLIVNLTTYIIKLYIYIYDNSDANRSKYMYNFMFVFHPSRKKEKEKFHRECVTFSWESVRESHDSHVIALADTALHSFVISHGGASGELHAPLRRASAISFLWSNIWRIWTTSTGSRHRGDSLPLPSANPCLPIDRPKLRCLWDQGSCIRPMSPRPRLCCTSSRYKDPIGSILSGWCHTCGCTSTRFSCFVASYVSPRDVLAVGVSERGGCVAGGELKAQQHM